MSGVAGLLGRLRGRKSKAGSWLATTSTEKPETDGKDSAENVAVTAPELDDMVASFSVGSDAVEKQRGSLLVKGPSVPEPRSDASRRRVDIYAEPASNFFGFTVDSPTESAPCAVKHITAAAAQAGFQIGDELVLVDETPVPTRRAFHDAIDEALVEMESGSVGERAVHFVVYRYLRKPEQPAAKKQKVEPAPSAATQPTTSTDKAEAEPAIADAATPPSKSSANSPLPKAANPASTNGANIAQEQYVPAADFLHASSSDMNRFLQHGVVATQPCRFFQVSKCQNGMSCTYAHRQEEMYMASQLCKFFMVGQCHKQVGCTFGHGEDEIIPRLRSQMMTHPIFERPVEFCKFHAIGQCTKGTSCLFRHV